LLLALTFSFPLAVTLAIFMVAMALGLGAKSSYKAGIGFCLVTTLFFAFDSLLYRGALSASSFLGYSPIEGARYYGIGNEVMGAWLGAAALGAGALLGRVHKAWLILAAFIITLCLGHPLVGAKAGGFLAALLTVAGFWWAQSNRPIKIGVAALSVTIIVAGGSIALILLGRFGHSHVTQSLQMARHAGVGAILDTIVRKIGMNLYLSVHSVWTILLIVCVAGARQLVKGIALTDRAQRAMVIGATSATAASLALNDAGVVAAAICALYVWSAAAYVNSLHRRHQHRIDAVKHTVARD
jgi:hypothetical protein